MKKLVNHRVRTAHKTAFFLPALALTAVLIPLSASDHTEEGSASIVAVAPTLAAAAVASSTTLALQPAAPAPEKPVPAVAAPVIPQLATPTRIVIPKIGINAQVLALGLEDGRMAVPHNFTQVGWFNESVVPGAIGAAVMGAHVDNGGSTPGVFKNLKTLVPGDSIYVYESNDTKLHFVMTKRTVFDKDATDTGSVFNASGIRELNIITCYGTWLPAQNTYASRLVVSATLVE